MARRLPREIAGFHFPKLFAVEMNDFDPEMILPGLFYLIRSKGRERGGRSEATDTLGYASAFTKHEMVQGFDSDVGLRLAHKWSRTSFARISRMGRSWRKGEQIAYLIPLSFLTYKPAFPTQSSRHRNVPRFLFDLMFRAADGMSWTEMISGRAETEPPLAALLCQAFSLGCKLSPGADLDAHYDGKTLLDTEVLASMHYADGFQAVQPKPRRPEPPRAPALPGAANALVRDVACFVTAYASRMPTVALARHLIALLSLELAAYTLRLMAATNQLVEMGQRPRDMVGPDSDASHIELYSDVTNDQRSESAVMAGQCVARDLEGIEHFFRSSLTLRTIDRYVEAHAKLRERFAVREGPQYLCELVALQKDPYIEIAAGNDLERIRADWSGSDGEGEAADGVGDLELRGDSDFEQLMDLLARAQGQTAVRNYTKWYRNICGLGEPQGILSGSLRHRSTWRYCLSPALLETLVQLCVVLPEYRPYSGMRAGLELTQQLEPMPVLLSDFLRMLRERFGILVDRPPAFRQDSQALQAAKQNLTALREQLRQMGLYEDLSDDFNAQYVHPRFRRRIRDFEAEQLAAAQ